MIRTHERRPVLRLAALFGSATSVGLFAASAAHAVDKLDTGVWWRDQTGAAALPSPPQVPAGGLWVSSDPTGPSAISAIRFTIADSEGFPKLSLRVAKLTAQPGTPVTSDAVPIRACVVTHDWTTPATFPGTWSSRPSYDCTKGSSPGQLSPDLSAVVFDLTVLPAAHSYDLVIVPGPAIGVVALPPLAVPAPIPPVPDPIGAASSPTFDVTFEPVKPSDLSVLPTSSPQAAPTPVTPAPAATTPPAAIAVGPAPLGSLDLPAALPVSQAPAAAPPTSVLPITERALGARPVAELAGTSRTHRVIAGLVFCALAAWAWRILAANGTIGTPAPAGRGALSLHDAVPLGTDAGLRRRFTTSGRTGAPPALR